VINTVISHDALLAAKISNILCVKTGENSTENWQFLQGNDKEQFIFMPTKSKLSNFYPH
tara:strand:+ start:110 stop:286 length:177 start_codon:yes stop_codon:yes gene_type:complete